MLEFDCRRMRHCNQGPLIIYHLMNYIFKILSGRRESFCFNTNLTPQQHFMGTYYIYVRCLCCFKNINSSINETIEKTERAI